MMKKIIVFVSVLFYTNVFSAPSETSFWQDATASSDYLQIEAIKSARSFQKFDAHMTNFVEPSLKGRLLNLNVDSLKHHLIEQGENAENTHNAKSAKSDKVTARSFSKAVPSSKKAKSVELSLPLPNGEFVRVRAISSPILSLALSEKYPDIKTWRVEGVEDPAISGRIDFTVNGFHGMLVLADGETIFIDPDKNQTQDNVYRSLSKRDNHSHFNMDFNCAVHGKHSVSSPSKNLSSKTLSQIPAADSLITYRIAVAGTAEYTNELGGKDSAYASMVTTINRVNEIYQRDLGITLELVSGKELVYTNALEDPYTNDDLEKLVSENMTNLHNNVGNENYDIGHVFAQGNSGGLAYVRAACTNIAMVAFDTVNGIKAGGATGLDSPEGEVFSIDFVAHEIGHQLGATHTFNSNNQQNCTPDSRTQETAVEPGSGSTIMAYSGLCGDDNLQNDSDAMFHWKSIEQIRHYTQTDHGANCGARTAINQNIVINVGAENSIVPLNMPFILSGSSLGGTSYAWDQMDTGAASAVDVDEGDNAIIRTELPSANPDRYIPRLLDLFTGSTTTGEILPSTERDMNFALVVRDGNGGVDKKNKSIQTVAEGVNFSVTSHDVDEVLTLGQSTTITWEVAETDLSPINCLEVDINLLRSDGVKNTLLLNTDNDGSETVVVPTGTPGMSNARIMVACASQPFFQISAGDISVPDTTPPVINILGASSVESVQGVEYIDQGATATDDLDTVVSVASDSDTAVNTSVIGEYTVTYTAVDQAGNEATIVTRIVNILPDIVKPIISLNGPSIISIFKGASYIDAGATALDNADGIIAVTSEGTVNTSTLGTYTITYNVTDQAGNSAEPVIRTVKVIAKPVSSGGGGGSIAYFFLALALLGFRRKRC
ncbi:MAG: immunoglobulin-like domain-containing protein [Cocleimonas sp.]